MKFDFVIGNPAYQEEVENNGRKNPLYNSFMDESYKVGNAVELITPARFLFNAGQTPKEWNRKMLNDPHLKVLYYEADSDKVFKNTDIKGGVVITYRCESQDFEPIKIFTHFDELQSIIKKIESQKSLADIIVGAVPYRFTECLRKEHPECVELIGSSFDLRTNVIDALQNIIFFDEPKDSSFVRIVGLYNKKRVERWIDKKYIKVPDNFESYKVLLPKANGAGKFGEVLAPAMVAEPNVGHTQTFISIGKFDTEETTKHLIKYIKCKFTRAMLGVLKTTQDCPAPKWKYVPMQDFTSNSDIDWSESVNEIDQQLYAKYGLTEDEIKFIESHVKEMN